MPSGASPRDTKSKVARTFSVGAGLLATEDQTPSAPSAALPYFPAGTPLGSAIASLPLPSAEASGKLGPILSLTALSAGAINTSRLPRRLVRVSGLIKFFLAR